ncbi:hypothetical protein ACQ86G_28590 [Roseateles chitinivorans]|uniref:hypothetical protein n=1 Tax=Roseateles chitinivorans TaxID=2917965 RepID=UPI003D679885
MGLDAQVIAIGPFSSEIADALEYNAQRYADVADGATVITTIFLAPTTGDSHALAAAFGVVAFETGKHHLDGQKADLTLLRDLCSEREIADFLSPERTRLPVLLPSEWIAS